MRAGGVGAAASALSGLGRRRWSSRFGFSSRVYVWGGEEAAFDWGGGWHIRCQDPLSREVAFHRGSCLEAAGLTPAAAAVMVTLLRSFVSFR
jgi:hypothetical protein